MYMYTHTLIICICVTCIIMFLCVSTYPCTQTPGRIQKVDPLMGVPVKYPE